MTFVIDIYDRYQDIADLVALERSPFDAAYVKGSDGGGPAIVRADNFVGAIKGIGLPVGLYHYAQLSPSPEVQANVLAQEVRRLGAFGLPPALDLEDPFRPNVQAREFARRFLLELRHIGFSSVVLYANTSMLTGIQAWTLDVPGLKIWAASYGGNDADYDQEDRERLNRAYPHPVWMHQYSSTGSVPGIPGNVDKNWMFDTLNGDDMLTQDDVDRVANAVWEQHRPHLDPASDVILPMWVWCVGANMGSWTAANRPIVMPTAEDIAAGLMTTLVPPLAVALAEHLPDEMDEERAQDIARMTVTNMAERMAASAQLESGQPPQG